jgi:hypothetical protein
MNPEDVRDIVSLVKRECGTEEGFEICVGGVREPDWERERAYIRSLGEVGATSWNEWIPPCDLETTRAAISQGPLRID